MKASELRIGNLVFDDEGILSKINGFQPYGHSIRCDELEGCELLIDLHPQDGTIRKGLVTDINFCKPIPLTEEWLIKFGFEKAYKTCYQYKDFILNDKFIMMDIDITVQLKHVHQLQNLYFALTGEEL